MQIFLNDHFQKDNIVLYHHILFTLQISFIQKKKNKTLNFSSAQM